MQPIIEARKLTKKYGEFTANKDINLSVLPGEVRAIIGENGAGKTTLMNMLYGILQPTEGEILFDGKIVHLNSPKDAIASGIGMVHQHFKLSPNLTVYENIVLGIEMKKTVRVGKKKVELPLIDNKKERAAVTELIKKYNFSLNPDDKIKDLSIGARQRVEILKMLYRQVKVLILDEPTAVLIPQEVDELITKIQDLKKLGQTVIIITHKLNEVKSCADTISVMRKGRLVDTIPNTKDTTMEMLAEMMVGRPVLMRVERSGKPVGTKPILEVSHLSAKNANGKMVLTDISFTIHENEILGIAGIEGNGQTELMYLLTGLMKPVSGSVRLEGEEILDLWPDQIRAKGVGIVPEDRYKQGICLSLPISNNLIAGCHKKKRFCRNGLMKFKEIQKNKSELIGEYDIRLSGEDPLAAELSGGNAQKVIIARELSNNPKVLLASQPTRGVDIGATEFIHQSILRLRDQGKAVFLISSELTEVKSLSDRILVIHEGQLVGEFDAEKISFNELGLYMSGAKKMDMKTAELDKE